MARHIWCILVLAGCIDGPTGAPGNRLAIEIERGNRQHGLAGEVLPQEIRVRVTEGGVPRVGEALQLSATDGGAIVSALAVTDANGRGSIAWRLGESAIGVQRLRVAVNGLEQFVEATAHAPELADVVIVSSGGSGIRGLVVARDGGAGDLAILHSRSAADSVVRLQPVAAGEADLIIFPRDHALHRSTHTFTAATDTFRITLRPAVALDVRIRIYEGPFEDQRAAALQQLESTRTIWSEQAAGMTFGDVQIVDETDSGANRDVLTIYGCSPALPGDIITINYVRTVNSRAGAGYACGSHTYLGSFGARNQNLLAHEIGHLLGLIHAPKGVMQPSPPGRELTDGELFRSHFSSFSVANTLYDAHPVELRRLCGDAVLSPCLPINFDLPAVP